jgi:tRNA pseudouridine38-40 synthase
MPHEPSRNIRLLLEYDGTDFQGWQIQAQGRTVQGELARALAILLREPIRPTGSGRTDAGTHALGQVAHFHTHSPLPCERILSGLNGLLPDDVAVRAVDEPPLYFHARYSARSKRYRYRIHLGKSALERRYVWTYRRPLDPQVMREAIRALPGRHAFGAFCKQDPMPADFHCQVANCTLEPRGSELVFEIEANRFLRHMVRILIGTLTEIGAGRRSPGDMATLLASGQRSQAGITAPAQGLCLLWVDYPDFP